MPLPKFRCSCTIRPMKGDCQVAVKPSPMGFLRCPFWALVLLALLAWQTSTTITLFSPDRSLQTLLDDQPILNGLHPLHLYHGLLGAQSWREGGYGSCYDPAFQAGYPKTPVFDSGSRPGELFLLLGHGRQAAYKIGLAICCALVPLVFATSARLLGLGPAASCVSSLLGILLWWSSPVQQILEHGQLDWLMAGLTLILHASFVVRFHRGSCPFIWLGMLSTAALGWFTHPILWLGFGLLFLPFLFCVATNCCVSWNSALFLSWIGGFALNFRWLRDWARNYWIQMPSPLSASQTWDGNLAKWFTIDLGGKPERMLAIFLLGAGLLGVFGFLVRRRWAIGLTFGATAIVLPALSLGTRFWKPLDVAGLANLFVLACAFAIVPCAAACRDVCELLGIVTRHPIRGKAITVALVAAGICWFQADIATLVQHSRQATPLHIGFTTDQLAIMRIVRASTRPDARILWEERPDHPMPTWSALLPQYTGRAFLGGLGPDALVDHSYARLTATELANRKLNDWTDAELAEFCTRYNIGYVVCWTPEVVNRFRSWPVTRQAEPVSECGAGWLMSLDRPTSYVLKGKASISQFDSDRIVLSNVEPEDGVVVLSLHYQNGLHISPRQVRAEREPDPDDPIPRLRLRIPSPVRRITLTWAKQ